jgi:hypothetical protein
VLAEWQDEATESAWSGWSPQSTTVILR